MPQICQGHKGKTAPRNVVCYFSILQNSAKTCPVQKTGTLPETNIAHENLIFPSKYHQNGGFSMAMLVYRSVTFLFPNIEGHLK